MDEHFLPGVGEVVMEKAPLPSGGSGDYSWGQPSQECGRPEGCPARELTCERGPEPEGEDRPAERLARPSRAGTGQ